MLLSRENSANYQEWLNQCKSDGAAVLIDKETGWTSFDVIAKLRRIIQIKKIGHAGTLDPLATGLLIVCIGKFTKKIEQYQGLPKTYIAEVKLGATTATDDSEMEEENITDTAHLSKNDIVSASKKLIGTIEQRPPNFSAKKIKGRKLYQLARKKIEIDIPPSVVTVNSINILDFNLPVFKAEINCEKGTYIRALARDIGDQLGVGGYLLSLKRTAIGDYLADHALKIQELEKLIVNNSSNT